MNPPAPASARDREPRPGPESKPPLVVRRVRRRRLSDARSRGRRGPGSSAPVGGSGVAGAVAAGAVGASPALVPAFLAACVTCAGVGPAVALGAAGGAGVSVGGVAFGVVVLVVVGAVQWLRLRRSCPVSPHRRRLALLRLATLVVAAAVSFAAVQWVIAPLLSPGGGSPPAGQLP